MDDLLKECTKMHEFNHPNVLKLLGVCLDGGPAPYIIMPFMTNGSLLSHLKDNRETLVIEPESPHADDTVWLNMKVHDKLILSCNFLGWIAEETAEHVHPSG